jgi:hypothetical protein
VRATILRWMRYGALVFGEMISINLEGFLLYWFCIAIGVSVNTTRVLFQIHLVYFAALCHFVMRKWVLMNGISESQRNTMLMRAVSKRIRHLRLLKWYMVAYYSCFRILLGGVSGGALPRKDCARASSAPGRGMLEV